MKIIKIILFLLLLAFLNGTTQDLSKSRFTLGRIHYKGGGDWYGNKTSLTNMLNFFEKTTGLPTQQHEAVVELDQAHFFNYPILYIAGHGNIFFNHREVVNLRKYLSGGGILYADDDYGMDKYFRRELKKIFPEKNLVEIPFDDSLFSFPFDFKNGAPKIHEHDGGPPKVFGLYLDKRLVCIYTFNTDISDGCEDQGIHDDSREIRIKAIHFSSNILYRSLTK